MRNPHGSFIWYELMTNDLDAALDFYHAVVGWETQDAGVTDHRYVILSAAGKGVGGAMTVPPLAAAKGAPPCWLGYIGVDDVDAAAAKLKEAGGTVHHGPEDLPGVGRFASVADPQGASFVLFRGNVDDVSGANQMGTPGHVGWNELHTSDWQAALTFYAAQFDWEKGEAMDMGEMGIYQLFGPAPDNSIGGMMNSPNMPRPMWLYYFCVDDIDAATKRVTDNKGEILFGPTEVPGGAWIIQCKDPQGVLFALVGMRN